MNLFKLTKEEIMKPLLTLFLAIAFITPALANTSATTNLDSTTPSTYDNGTVNGLNGSTDTNVDTSISPNSEGVDSNLNNNTDINDNSINTNTDMNSDVNTNGINSTDTNIDANHSTTFDSNNPPTLEQ